MKKPLKSGAFSQQQGLYCEEKKKSIWNKAGCECLILCPAFVLFSLLYRIIIDDRLPFTILEGYVIVMGYSTGPWIPKGKMDFPYSDELEAKIVKLENKGCLINYAWSGAKN